MVSFLEICRRAASGPIVAPDDFDMERMVPNLQKAIAQHGLKAPPKDVVIPWDDDLADPEISTAKDTRRWRWVPGTQRPEQAIWAKKTETLKPR